MGIQFIYIYAQIICSDLKYLTIRVLKYLAIGITSFGIC